MVTILDFLTLPTLHIFSQISQHLLSGCSVQIIGDCRTIVFAMHKKLNVLPLSFLEGGESLPKAMHQPRAAQRMQASHFERFYY